MVPVLRLFPHIQLSFQRHYRNRFDCSGLNQRGGGEEKKKMVQHNRWDNLVLVQMVKRYQNSLHMLPLLSCLGGGAMKHLCSSHLCAELQHGYALWRTVEMCGCAASPGGLEALSRPAQSRAPGPGAHHNPGAQVVTLLQACHHGLAGDGAKLVGEGAVEDEDVHREDPLADGRGVLKDEALVDEEDAAWGGS